jgi:hypothetical protein
MPDMPDLAALRQFGRLVVAGRRKSASDAETGAKELAAAVLDHAAALDHEEISGLLEWIEFVRHYPTAAEIQFAAMMDFSEAISQGE